MPCIFTFCLLSICLSQVFNTQPESCRSASVHRDQGRICCGIEGDAAGKFFCGVFSRTKYFLLAHKMMMMCLFSAKEFIRDEVPWKWAVAPSRQRRKQTQFDASRTQSRSRDGGRRQRSERKWRQTERGGLLSILQDAACRPLAQGLHHEE